MPCDTQLSFELGPFYINIKALIVSLIPCWTIIMIYVDETEPEEGKSYPLMINQSYTEV